MNQPTQFNATNTKLVKLLKKTIKTVMTKQGVNPSTRKGNKELDILVKQLAKQSFTSEEQAKIAAEKFGESLVELSQKNGKTYLDQGVVKQFSLVGISSISAFASSTKEAKTISNSSITPIEDKVVDTEAEIPEKTLESSVEEVEATLDKMVEPEAEIPETILESLVEEVEATVKNSASGGLKERLTEDIKLAMKARDKIRLETVRSIKKVVLEKEVEVRPKGQETLTPEQELEVLSQQAKQRRESIEQYRQGGRDDLADKEAQELAIIETYLPAQLSDEEIGEIIDKIIASSGATSSKDIGKVMGPAMKELKGKADGKKVQEMVKSKLS